MLKKNQEDLVKYKEKMIIRGRVVSRSNKDLFSVGIKRSFADFTQNTTPAGLISSTPNKRQKVPSVKRSQKLTNKITALQKLVSPYGKTDTASVLLEASISIKALHHQIQDLFHRLTKDNLSQSRGERHDLKSRGLCLVPVSFSFPNFR